MNERFTREEAVSLVEQLGCEKDTEYGGAYALSFAEIHSLLNAAAIAKLKEWRRQEPVAVVDSRIPGNVRWGEWSAYPDGTKLYTHTLPAQPAVNAELLVDVCGHYEAALIAALPNGGRGEAFVQWNEARKLLANRTQAAQPVAAVQDADPLQGAVDWFLQADGEFFCVATVQRTLRIGYNRAKRLCDVAKERAAAPQPQKKEGV